MNKRFVVREATGPAWDWLPDWLVIDTEKKVRAAAYHDEKSAIFDASERNADQTPTFLAKPLQSFLRLRKDKAVPDTQKTIKGVREAPTASKMELRYEETGEVRPPRAGEWFRTSRGGEERARFDFSVSPLPILKEIFQPKETKNA